MTPDETAAMAALSEGFRAKAAQRAQDVQNGMASSRDVVFALDFLWDVVALEVASALALDITPPTIEQALAEHDLAPAIAERVRMLRAALTN